MRAFITGTDTSVGKTYATARLARCLRRCGMDTVALKPVCSGDRSDAEILRAACGDELPLDAVNPFWLRAPLAPLSAARVEGRTISVGALEGWFRDVSRGRRSVLVEGAGGWLVPLAEGVMIADLAELLGLPVIVVAANRLGCVNHTLLTVESIRARGMECAGVILNSFPGENDESSPVNRALIEEFARLPVLFEIAPGQAEIPALGEGTGGANALCPKTHPDRALGSEF